MFSNIINMEKYLEFLPEEIFNKIMLYNSHPVSDLVNLKIDKHNQYLARGNPATSKKMSFVKHALMNSYEYQCWEIWNFLLKPRMQKRLGFPKGESKS